MISFCGWISDRRSFTIPAPSSRYNMPIWLRSHRDGVTHDLLWFAQFIFRCCFQYHLNLNHTSQSSQYISIISSSPIIFNESFKHINFSDVLTTSKSIRHLEEILPNSAEIGGRPGQVVLWRFGLCDPGGPVSHWPVATDQVRAHAEHHQGREGRDEKEVQGLNWLDLVVISWDFTVLTGFSGFTQSFL